MPRKCTLHTAADSAVSSSCSRAAACSSALPPPPLLKRATRWLLKVALGIELAPPTVQGLQAYAVAKPMLGFVDVLYADDGLRVTRGNRGSLVVTQRVR